MRLSQLLGTGGYLVCVACKHPRYLLIRQLVLRVVLLATHALGSTPQTADPSSDLTWVEP